MIVCGKAPPPPPHGAVTSPPSPWLPDSVVTYSCDINYQLKSGGESRCEREGRGAVWRNDTEIKCIPGTGVCLCVRLSLTILTAAVNSYSISHSSVLRGSSPSNTEYSKRDEWRQQDTSVTGVLAAMSRSCLLPTISSAHHLLLKTYRSHGVKTNSTAREVWCTDIIFMEESFIRWHVPQYFGSMIMCFYRWLWYVSARTQHFETALENTWDSS